MERKPLVLKNSHRIQFDMLLLSYFLFDQKLFSTKFSKLIFEVQPACVCFL